MRIRNVRRISQFFFFITFLWFCIVTTIGTEFWQLKGWAVNLFLQLDPFVGISTVLTTHTLYAGLLWGLVTIILTIIFGRFFCGWVCPFGSVHHFVGYITNRKKTAAQKIHLNRYRKGAAIKYFLLIFFIVAAVIPGKLFGSLQTGLLDPIPLLTRSVNIVLLPILDSFTNVTSVVPRYYQGAWILLSIFFAAVFLNLLIPRFYCRFICPLGALFAVLSRFSIWRIGKKTDKCSQCMLCETACEGACHPASEIRISECVLCFNCTTDCKDGVMVYQSVPSLGGEKTNPDISRRGFLLSVISGFFAIPAIRLAGGLGSNWNHKLIRPPGSLGEPEFLKRCIKCGQCMRVCPSNVIQPAGLQTGVEALWTPTLNNTIGSSGCQLNCTACGSICPTAAIRPITLDEKLGRKKFADTGPIKLGTAFVDRSRCLPWAMGKPCIVCQENCPLSPKAIYTKTIFSTVRNGLVTVKKATPTKIEVLEDNLSPDKFATGDYYCFTDTSGQNQGIKIVANTENTLTMSQETPLKKIPISGSKVQIKVRLQRPFVDIEKCIGCGICEHECPVSGKRAIRVSAEGETRNPGSKMFLRS